MTPPDEELPMPCAVAMVAATFALMTAWASPEPAARVTPAELRRLLARKIVSNLFFLREHPQLDPRLRQVVAQAHAHWTVLAAGQASPMAAQPHASLH